MTPKFQIFFDGKVGQVTEGSSDCGGDVQISYYSLLFVPVLRLLRLRFLVDLESCHDKSLPPRNLDSELVLLPEPLPISSPKTRFPRRARYRTFLPSLFSHTVQTRWWSLGRHNPTWTRTSSTALNSVLSTRLQSSCP